MNLYPLRLTPVSKEILWGGRKLKDKYNKTATFEKLAESWELTVRPDEMNLIKNGDYTGMTLGEYIRACGPTVISPTFHGDRFPLLIKFIDACDRLSIQVHPDDETALSTEGELGKTEMWYIVEAEPGAQLVYGLRGGVSAADFAAAVQNDTIEETLRFVDVHPGEVYFIPSGQIHAIGAGILIAEIQQNSNVTYRVYDYNRRGADGSLRPLHTEKALKAARIRTDAEIEALRFTEPAKDPRALADCAYFRVRKVDLSREEIQLTAKDSFLSLLCLEGENSIQCESVSYSLCKGDSYFVPCGCSSCYLTGDGTVLITETKE